MIDQYATQYAQQVIGLLRTMKVRVGTAESLTGGLIAATLTSIPKASEVVVMGAVVYTWEAKQRMVLVPRDLLEEFSAESEPVARAMALGVLTVEPLVDLSVAVTGVAGPGAYEDKPAGRVHIAVALRVPGSSPRVIHRQMDYGEIGREAVRLETLKDALVMMESALNFRGA